MPGDRKPEQTLCRLRRRDNQRDMQVQASHCVEPGSARRP
jgi:hypothetical protein